MAYIKAKAHSEPLKLKQLKEEQAPLPKQEPVKQKHTHQKKAIVELPLRPKRRDEKFADPPFESYPTTQQTPIAITKQVK